MSKLPDIGSGEEYELNPDAVRLYDLAADGKLIGWRRDELVKLGFSETMAETIALHRDVDLERVRLMRAGGATCELIERILL